MDNLQQEKTEHERITGHDITWQDVLIAQDALMEALKQKLNDEPEHGKYWQERLAVEMLRRQEILILAKQQSAEEEREERQSE